MKDKINILLDNGFLVSPDFVVKDVDFVLKRLQMLENKPLFLYDELFIALDNDVDVDWYEFDRVKVEFERGYVDAYNIFLSNLRSKKKLLKNGFNKEISFDRKIVPDVVVLRSFKEESKKRSVDDFIYYFKSRYEYLKKIFIRRNMLSNLLSIDKVFGKVSGEFVSLIGLVFDKRLTSGGHILLTIEDLTGMFNVLINKNNKELFELGKEIVLDEVVGVSGVLGDKILFCEIILFPDIVGKRLKKASDEVYAAFISDLHVGSKLFLEEEFLRFIKWLNGEDVGFKYENVVNHIKYLFIVGDICDGIGVYPEQDKELEIKEIKKQYDKAAKFLDMIPKNIKIIICPGNHDALRLSEPQPVLDKNFAEALYKLDNVIIVSNPALVNIHSSEDFVGFDVLLYHGYCFDYYVSNVDSIKGAGGYDKVDLLMSLFLKKRHLAPTHGSTLYVPGVDNMIIDKVPDFFVSGHIHKASVSYYKGVTNICCSCWQSKTSFQEKVGHDPEPARVPVVNLKSRDIKILRFD